MDESIAGASQIVSILPPQCRAAINSPIVSLHEAPENDISVGIWSWNDVCLVVFAMSHDIGINLWRPCKQDLTSHWKAIRILNTRQVSSSVAYAIENDFRTLTQEGMI